MLSLYIGGFAIGLKWIANHWVEVSEQPEFDLPPGQPSGTPRQMRDL